jgi:2-desacetyl-2-hydroxyethyl bacteriochlorophyllide A dehydrogenase
VQAAVLEGPRRLIVREVDDPRPTDGDVAVAVELAGVCGSDVSLYLGKRPVGYPVILGHEAIGRVVEPGSSGLPIGAQVALEPNVPCGACTVCQRGRGDVCPRKRSLGLNSPGVFADRVLVPPPFVHPVPPGIDPCDAVGVEPLAVAVHAFRLGGARSGDPVAVVGCGSQGLLMVQVAVALGARVLAADTREDRLAVATALGAATTLLVEDGALPEQVGVRVEVEWGPIVVFECAGAALAAELALHAAAPGGRVVAVGLATEPVPVVPLRFVRRGLSLVGSLIYDHPVDFERSIELLRSGAVRPSTLVTSVHTLADAAAALERAASGQTGKVLVDVAGVLAR